MKRAPTIIDVAKAAGVSTATVSRVVNGGVVKGHTRSVVESAIRDLNYRPNTVARGLVTGRTDVIGVLIPDVTGPLYAQMARGIEEVLMPLGLHYLVVSDNRDPAEEHSSIELFLERRVDALIIIGGYLSAEALASLVGDSVPTVLVQPEAAETPCRFSTFELDNASGTLEALDHLHAAGHRKLAHIAGLRRDGLIRRELFERRVTAWGYEPVVIATDGTEAGGYHAALALQDEVTAVFCVNDRAALGFYRGAKERGLDVPEDISVVGFDDLLWSAYLDPPLTTVKQPARALGRAAAEQALALRSGGAVQAKSFSSQLVKRQSVKTLTPGRW